MEEHNVALSNWSEQINNHHEEEDGQDFGDLIGLDHVND